LVGIAASDDIHYIKFFREKFKVPFPLFPDKSREIHKLLGEPKVPFFIGLKLKKGGKKEIFYTHLGVFKGGAAEFLQLIMKKSGLK